jgi:hypothetical protein
MKIHFDLVHDKLSSFIQNYKVNSHLKITSLLVFLSDYTKQIHYTATVQHVKPHSFKGKDHHVHHINHMTHA